MDHDEQAAAPPVVPVQRGRAPSRRGVVRAGVAGLAVAAVAGAGGSATRYRDTASARARGDGAGTTTGTGARSVRVLWRAGTSDKVMALTFDDGPGPALTAPLLDALREQGVRATFCVVGRQAYALPDLVRRQVREGHELANHTWSHADLSLAGYETAKHELERTDALLAELSGRRPRVIRPPYGRVDGALLRHASEAGQDVLLWDVRFEERAYDSAGNVEHVLRSASPGTVVLGHDHGSADRWVGTHAVPGLVREAKRRGYAFLTASEMLERDGSSLL